MSEAAARDIDTGTGDLLCRVEDRVAVLTLNRPEARNALSWELKVALVEQVPRLGADPSVGCLLLTGAGGAFCAGGDTKNMAREGRPPSPEERKRILRFEHALPEAIHRLEGRPALGPQKSKNGNGPRSASRPAGNSVGDP